jgi:superfamily II DNA or RNA helicase
MKDYDGNVFDSFGLTIADECHHISAEVFCRSLFKIVTPYMLGLSATMNRKDGLTKVFKMFLGDVLYREERESDDAVNVRCIEYKNSDEDFSETVYNFKGQTHYAIMIRKLCEFNHRSEFILRVLKDMLQEMPNQQIMILAHNKSLLKYLHDAVEHRKIASVGYYVGGMKEAALKETESKQVVIATYAMAEEALDIKSLASLIMATPKTDVTQAVGRILRMKHEKPIVVDIVDQHDIFQKQWVKRRRFYVKCNYKITTASSNDYTNAFDSWDVVYEPGQKSRVYKKRIEKKDKGPLMQGKCFIKIDTEVA